VWAAMQRSVNGSTVYYLEKYDPDSYTDCAQHDTSGTAKTSWTSLSLLEGEDVVLKGDGEPMGTDTVAAGVVTTPAAVLALEAGLSMVPNVVMLPPAPAMFGQRMALRRKRILRAVVDVVASVDIRVGLVGQTTYRLDPIELGFGAPTAVTKPLEQRFLGWAVRPQVQITQTDPLPWTIRGVELEVEAHF